MVQNGHDFLGSFDTDSMDLNDIEVSGVDNETPLAQFPIINITEDTESYRSLTPDFTPTYDTQDSITVDMDDRSRPVSVSEVRERPRPPPRSQTVDDRSRYRRKDHPHFSIKMSPQYNNRKRMSFLYKPQMEFSGMNSRSQSLVSNSSFHSAIFDNILTPFARVVMQMKHIRENLNTLEKNINMQDPNNDENKEEASRMQVNNLYLLHNSIQEIDDCLEIVESLENGKSIGESAGDKFRQILQLELQHLAPSPANARVAEWVVSEFVGQDNDINGFISDECEMDTSMYQICPIEPNERKMSGLMNSISAPGVDSNAKKRVSIPNPIQNKSDIRSNTELLSYVRENVSNWNVDIFKINQLSQGYPLAACAYVTMQSHDLFKQCKIDETCFINYITDVENEYRDNPYHNGLHAADVVLNANYLLSCDNLECVLQDLMVLGLIISAAIHDCDHPGKSNKFLISTKNDLALIYNDESVLENHHCATGFKLLQKPKNNIFANFSNKAYMMIRRLIIDLVLATDMSKHLNIIGKLKTTIEYFKIKEREEIEMSSSNLTDILHALLHCADLGNPAKPRDIAIAWSRRLEEELYKQGDEERKLGIEISHMCDRENPIFEKNQYSFLTFVALPLWESWAELVYPHASIMIDHLLDNKEYWESVQPLTPTENENDTTIAALDDDD